MMHIPVYLKTDDQAERPSDDEFYWVTRSGTFLCRNHPFFRSDVETMRSPRTLAPHAPACVVNYPRLGTASLEYIVAFFARVYELHQSEAIVLLYWDSVRERYKLRVPEQEATVWESYSGRRSPMDVSYTPPLDVPPQEWLVGDIHSHGDGGAYASHKDRMDERYQDGIHAVVGRVEQEPPQFQMELSVDGTPFQLRFEHVFQGYGRRRRVVPQAWLDRVKVVVERSYGWGLGAENSHSSYSKRGANSTDGYYRPGPRRGRAGRYDD